MAETGRTYKVRTQAYKQHTHQHQSSKEWKRHGENKERQNQMNRFTKFIPIDKYAKEKKQK